MEIIQKPYNNSTDLQLKSGLGIGFVTVDAFANCQINTWGAFCNLLQLSLADQKEAIVWVHRNIISKTQLLIDVNTSYSGKVEALFNKDEIIFKQPYRNNTGSQMIMYMLQKLTTVARFEKEIAAAKIEAAKAKVVTPDEKAANDLKAKQAVPRTRQPF